MRLGGPEQSTPGRNLMIGKKPLWVAKQHGHSLETMLRMHTAWGDGAVEADIRQLEKTITIRSVPPSAASLGRPTPIVGRAANAQRLHRTAAAPAEKP